MLQQMTLYFWIRMVLHEIINQLHRIKPSLASSLALVSFFGRIICCPPIFGIVASHPWMFLFLQFAHFVKIGGNVPASVDFGQIFVTYLIAQSHVFSYGGKIGRISSKIWKGKMRTTPKYVSELQITGNRLQGRSIPILKPEIGPGKVDPCPLKRGTNPPSLGTGPIRFQSWSRNQLITFFFCVVYNTPKEWIAS